MKIEVLEKNEIRIKIDNLDDLWYLSTILAPGDLVFGTVFRKEERSGDMVRSKKTARKKIRVGINVERTEFQEFSDRLRVMGVIVAGPEEYIGQHQTINVGVGDEISVVKEWSKSDMQLLEEAVKNAQRPMVYFLAIEHGLAVLAVLRSYGVQELITLRKRGDEDEEFFGEVLAALENTRTEDAPLVILGPGFYKENFVKFAKERLKNYTIAQASHGDMRGIYEVLKSGVLERILKEHRVSVEEKLVSKLLEEIKKEGLYAYGVKDVKRYVEMGAVEHLLVSDKTYRKYADILEIAQQTGAKIHIISTTHEAGRILYNLGGIAALLRFK